MKEKSMYKVRGNMVYITISGLTELDDEFDLPDDQFLPNSVGKVVDIVSQTAGDTEVKLQIIQGGVRPTRQVDRSQFLEVERPSIDRDGPLLYDHQGFASSYDYEGSGHESYGYGGGHGYDPNQVQYIDYELPKHRFEEDREVIDQGIHYKPTAIVERGVIPGVNGVNLGAASVQEQGYGTALDMTPRRGNGNRQVENSPIDYMMGGPIQRKPIKRAVHPTEAEYGKNRDQRAIIQQYTGINPEDIHADMTASEIFAHQEGLFDNTFGRAGGQRRSQMADTYGRREHPHANNVRILVDPMEYRTRERRRGSRS